MMGHRHKWVSVFAGIILVTLVTSGCGERAETGPAEKVKAGDVRQVRVSPVQASPPKGSIEYVGVLAAHTKATVSSEMSGTIERLHFEKGDRVRGTGLTF